jgi:ribosomal protein S6--L-glutamate ligase
MILSFHPCITADAQVILGDRSLGTEEFSLIRQARAILLPQSCPENLYLACRESSALLFPNYEKRYSHPGKLGQNRLFEEMRWPHPGTIQWDSVEAFETFQRERKGLLPHQLPFLLKRDKSHEGDGVYLIEDHNDLDWGLKEIAGKGDSAFLSQEWIPSAGNVLRAVLLGERTITYWKRSPGDRGPITTINRGAQVDSEWMPDLQERAALQAARISGDSGINVAALDFVMDLTVHDPDPLLLEINYYFGRRGLGGSLRYYRLLVDAARGWLKEKGLDAGSIGLV